MYTEYEWVKVKNSVPEQFMLIALDPALPKESFMQVGPPVAVAELRAKLKADGRSEAEINSLLERARTLEA